MFSQLQIEHKDLNLASEKNDGFHGKSGHETWLLAKYNHLVNRLPSDFYRQCLVQNFFDEVNWVYSILDPNLFQSQLRDWQQSSQNKPSEVDLNKLSLDCLYFPALLFQVLGLSLLSIPPTIDVDLEPLKNGKSVNVLAAEYSHCGCDLISLLGREDPCLTSIQLVFSQYICHK